MRKTLEVLRNVAGHVIGHVIICLSTQPLSIQLKLSISYPDDALPRSLLPSYESAVEVCCVF